MPGSVAGRDVICLSSIDWDFIWQGHQEIMARLAASGHRVLFVENTGVRPVRWSDLPRLKSRLYGKTKFAKLVRWRTAHAFHIVTSPGIGTLPLAQLSSFASCPPTALSD